MNNSKKIIVFDFDGVVCDSSDECMVTSWNAWEKWNFRDNFRNNLSKFTKNYQLNFRKVRPRVRGAGEYYILCRSFSEGIDIDDQETYDRLENEWYKDISLFKSFFFKARERLRQIDVNSWINLHPVFDDVIEVMKYLSDQNRLYIATLKDAQSVNLILSDKGLIMNEDRLLDQSQITSKLQALDKFRKQIGCRKEDMIFIDDNVTHLLDPKEAKYNVFLTTWGMCLDEYLNIAKINNIQLLDKCTKLIHYE